MIPPPLDEAIRKMLEKYTAYYSPAEMVAELQSVIDGINAMKAYEADNAANTFVALGQQMPGVTE